MSSTIQGNATLSDDTPEEIVFDEYGVASATIYLSGLYTSAVSTVSGMLVHPRYPYLKRKFGKITRMEAGLCTATVTFEGIPPTAGGGGGTSSLPTPPKYSLRGSLSTSPIETHPRFPAFAGIWQDSRTWKNGALFEFEGPDRGTFKGFKPYTNSTTASAAERAWAGVKSYEDPGLIFEETVLYPSAPSGSAGGIGNSINITALGKIDVPPNVGKYIQLSGGQSARNWLFISCDIDEIGFGFKVTKRWRLSGVNGWNPIIYT